MSDLHVQPAADGTPGLSQLQRVSNAFSAPSKTFEDIKRGNASWWMPFLLFVLIGMALWAAVNAKVDWVQVAENGVKMSPKAADALDKLSPEQRENQIRVSSNIQKAIWGAAPVGVLLLDLIAAGVLVASINFGFGGKATFGKTLAVVWYAGLPGLVKLVLGAVGLFAGVAPDASCRAIQQARTWAITSTRRIPTESSILLRSRSIPSPSGALCSPPSVSPLSREPSAAPGTPSSLDGGC